MATRLRCADPMDLLWKDIRYSIQSLRANPGFALVSILTLALGIGATTAIFSVVNGVLLRPLPIHDPSRVVIVSEHRLDEPDGPGSVSPANYVEWTKETRTFSSIGSTFDWELSVTGQGDPELVRSGLVSGTLFPTLAVRPYLGRALEPRDAGGAAPFNTVLSHAYWQRKFGGDRKVIGKRLTIDGQTHIVVGVMPREFFVPQSRAELWVPFDPKPDSRGRFLQVIGRLAPGVSIAQAQASMKVAAERLAIAYPRWNANQRNKVDEAHEKVVGNVRRALLIVLAAVGLLLIIGCVNIANLLLSRATTRSKEMAVRAALGASRGRLLRQLLTESLILAILGGVLGVVLAGWATMLLVRFTPESALMPRTAEIAVDGRVLALSALITIATGVFFGIAPSLEASRTDLRSGLNASSRGATQDRRGKMFRNTLVVAEVALATVLLIGAGLLIKSFGILERVDPGVDAEGVLTLRVSLPEAYAKPERRDVMITQLLEKVRQIPGVERVGAIVSINMPFTNSRSATDFAIVGQPKPAEGHEPTADIRPIAGDYFQAMGISILSGRSISNRVTPRDQTEFVVNEAFARKFLDGKALGRQLDMEWYGQLEGPIVGVVGNVRAAGLGEDVEPAIYFSYNHDLNSNFTLAVASSVDPMSLQTPVTSVVRSIDKQTPVSNVATLGDLISGTIARPRFNATMLSIFAALGLILASVGIYGVLSYTVSQRTHEMGIRMALGADPRDVLRLVVRDGMRVAIVGVLVGVGAALLSTRVMGALLYGVGAADPGVFASVALTLTAVALAASYIPARRATRVNPMVALRPQ